MKILDKELNSNPKKSPKRLGRGISAGGGKTAGRGTKGQKSRAGHNIPKRFEGGETPLSMRLPKLRGFKTKKKEILPISLNQISENFKNGDKVTKESLIEKKLITKKQTAKILNNGKISIKIEVVDISISKSAQKAIDSFKPKENSK